MGLVKKAVILAAGRGTRFLPYTKATPKEMIAVVDKPALHYIVDEIVNYGIKDILIIYSKEKTDIKKYFERNIPLENFLLAKRKTAQYELVKSIGQLANFSYVIQEEATGSGAAVLLAREFADGQPVAILNGDDAMYTLPNAPTVIGQLCDCYDKYQTTVVGVQPVSAAEISRYGAIDIVSQEGRAYNIKSIIEKPSPETAPSLIASLGRYVISGDFFDYITKTPVAANGELQFTDAIKLQAEQKGIYAYDFVGHRYDLGDKLGYMKASVEVALKHPEIGQQFAEYLKDQIQTLLEKK